MMLFIFDENENNENNKNSFSISSFEQKLFDCLKLDDIAATIVTSHLEQLNDKEDFSDWMDKNNNDVDVKNISIKK